MQKQSPTPKTPVARGKSSTLDILGLSKTAPRSSKHWGEHYALLTEAREHLSGNIEYQHESARQEISGLGEHMADSATDSYDRDYALAMLSSTQSTLGEIEQAIKRILAGTYGICELTGERIEAERLRAIPWTRYCAKAQAEVEAQGFGNHVQLGQLGVLVKESATEEEDESEVEPERGRRRRNDEK
jgi:RNA polymerase-binding transcription factor DksA